MILEPKSLTNAVAHELDWARRGPVYSDPISWS